MYNPCLKGNFSRTKEHLKEKLSYSIPFMTQCILDGRKEEVYFDKITSRIQKLCYGLNMDYVNPVSFQWLGQFQFQILDLGWNLEHFWDLETISSLDKFLGLEQFSLSVKIF